MDQNLEFLKLHCLGWVLFEHRTRYYEGDHYGVFHVSDQLTTLVRGCFYWVEGGSCLAHPFLGTEKGQIWEPEPKIVVCRPMEETHVYRMGNEFWGCVKYFPLEKRAELDRAMYERKFISKKYYELKLMRGTELRP